MFVWICFIEICKFNKRKRLTKLDGWGSWGSRNKMNNSPESRLAKKPGKKTFYLKCLNLKQMFLSFKGFQYSIEKPEYWMP